MTAGQHCYEVLLSENICNSWLYVTVLKSEPRVLYPGGYHPLSV
jgi:hypothetical protein